MLIFCKAQSFYPQRDGETLMCLNASRSWYSPLPTTARSISCSCVSLSSFSVCAKTYLSTLYPQSSALQNPGLHSYPFGSVCGNPALSGTGRITFSTNSFCFVFNKPFVKFSSFFVGTRPFLLEQFHLFFQITEITWIRKPALKSITTYFFKDIRSYQLFKSSLVRRPTSLLPTFF